MSKVKLAFIINDEYTWAFGAFKSLIPLLSKEYDIKGIILLPDKIGRMSFFEYITWNLKIFGIYNTMILAIFVAKRWFLRQFYTICNWSTLSLKYKFDILNSDSANSDNVIQWIERNKIDIIFLHTNQIISEKLISSVRIGIINKHASLLPSCRGVFPFFWSKLLKLPIGLTFHTISAEIDKGQNIIQLQFKKFDGSLLSFYIRIYSMFPCLALLSIKSLINKEFINNKKHIEDSYFSFPTKSDYLAFRKARNKISQFSDLL
jgi:folate-dependent phosphoribosylglycinamide formyltransferase PurN